MKDKMRSVVFFIPNEREEKIDHKWRAQKGNKSAIGDKYVPTVVQTRKMMHG